MDSNFITIEAIIQRAQKRDHALELKLISRDGKVKAYIRGYSGAEPFDHLIDSKVELTGTCGFEFSPDMEILGTLIYLNDQDQMKILQDGRTSFEQAPIDRLSKLDFSNSGEEVASRILLKGHYMGDANQNNFYFQTEYQGFIVHPVQTDASVEFGQEIEVLGWPRLQDYSFEIVDAVLRRHVAIAVLDNLAQSGMLLDSSNLNRFVRRSGFLTRFERHDERMTLHIDSSGQHLIANLEFHDNDMERDYEIPVGSEIEVSGILVSVPGKTSIGEIPAIKLRSFDSIKELAPPSFLTIQRIRWLVIVAGAIGVGSLLWGLTLKGQVRHQTAKIRKTVEMERQAKERFQRLFESALDMIFLCDTSARIISMNQAGLHLIGEDFSDVKGKSLLNWVLPADRNIAEEALGLGSKAGRKLASEGEVIELQLKISDGQSVYIELSIRGFLLRKGGVGYQCIARNVEARKQSEAHLIKARDAYREANKAKSVFLAMMSHELRTPMNGVIGMTQLLLKTSLNGEQEDQANTILASSRGMMRLILDLLDISRIESDKLILSEESFGLVELVEEVLATLSVEADRKQLDLTLLFQPRMNRQYRGDGTRLRQVLLNLVGNGIKFTERGGVAVKVMEGVASSKGEQIRIEVEDTGIGIGDGDKKDLFEAFIQLDSSDTRKFGGAGLGLTICKRIVQAMGGVIGVEAQSQRGSSFWVEIPFKVIDKRSVIRTPPIVIPADRPGILLVSNSSLVREYFRKRMNQSEQLLSIETSTDFLYRLSKSTLIKDQRKFYAVMIDFARTEKEFLKTLSKFADGFLGPEIKWVFIEPVSGQSDQARMMDHFSSKLKILKPLTETTFHHVCQFLNSTKSDRANVNESCNKNKLLTEGRDSKTIVSDARLKVLVAEDDPINQKLISLYLKKAGCHSILVPDGKQVLQKLNEGTFDVILMDCSMPVMDGFEASRQIRSKPKFKNLRIIALTAHSLKGDRERCFAAGMDDYLPKPLNLDLLTEKLSR
ncbi:MAG: response regulator, partial [Verrucomicrobia bacterium]|nr:response regulator [Verrucomicrobiota bacterium]